MTMAGQDRRRRLHPGDVLPFHRLGAAKYTRLGLPFSLADTPPADSALLQRVRDQFTAAGLTTC